VSMPPGVEPPPYVAFAIPVFLLMIATEVWLARRRGVQVYRFDDALTDLACGVGSQAVGALWKTALLLGYVWLYEHRLATMAAWAQWLLAFVWVDFAYYWWHRWSHETNLLWAAHVVHHQSEDYNLAVALRQAWFTPLTAWPFYAPLALAGVTPIVIGSMVAFSTLYQFWIHTELIGRMPVFEWIFNAPMHHRVHHAINPRYLDKNYAAVLIVWDRLFGTYLAEEEPCVYGIVKPLHSYDTVWCNFHHWLEVIRHMRQTRSWVDKVRIWFRSPAWLPADLPQYPPPPQVTRETRPKYSHPVPVAMQRYLGVQLLLCAATVGVLLVGLGPLWLQAGLIALTVVTLWTWSGLIEGKPWARKLERARLLAGLGLAVAALWVAGVAPGWLLVPGFAIAGLWLWLPRSVEAKGLVPAASWPADAA
jgi:alkylglycerol monooxygenase